LCVFFGRYIYDHLSLNKRMISHSNFNRIDVSYVCVKKKAAGEAVNFPIIWILAGAGIYGKIGHYWQKFRNVRSFVFFFFHRFYFNFLCVDNTKKASYFLLKSSSSHLSQCGTNHWFCVVFFFCLLAWNRWRWKKFESDKKHNIYFKMFHSYKYYTSQLSMIGKCGTKCCWWIWIGIHIQLRFSLPTFLVFTLIVRLWP
jgi:hypothetical protein